MNFEKLKRQVFFKIAYRLLSSPPLSASRRRGGVDLKIFPHPKESETCLVIGNGPSLTKSIPELLHKAKKADVVTVNHFSEDSLFGEIKPTKHVLLDSYFWADDAAEELIEKREKFYTSLKKVDWLLKLYIPSYADQNYVRSKVTNANVSLVFFGGCPVTHIPLKIPTSLTANLYETSNIIPPVCNVLIYGVYIAVLSGYRQIEIYGADLSFHLDVEVDQTSNDLLVSYSHYYGKTEMVRWFKNPQRTQPFTMHELMSLTADTYYAHKSIYLMAKNRNIKIYNKSLFSIIDVYPRT